jgi:hypothetical protein
MLRESSGFNGPEITPDLQSLTPIDRYVAERFDSEVENIEEAIAYFGPIADRADLVIWPILDGSTKDDELGRDRLFEMLKAKFAPEYPGWVMTRETSDLIPAMGKTMTAREYDKQPEEE